MMKYTVLVTIIVPISVRNVEYCLKNESSKNNFGVYQTMKKQGGKNRT